MTQIHTLHEPDCERNDHPCCCGMYAIDENLQCLGNFTLSREDVADMLANDSLGG